jgi:iron complex outermembrane receptor protein
MKLKFLKMSGCLLTFCLTMGPFTLWSAETDKDATVEMNRITVTANKIEEDIRDVPQSISVIDEVVLDEKGITTIPEVIREIPNMSIATGAHGNAVSFRGLNPSLFTNSNPVVLYIDGVPMIDRYGFDASLANIERIEVLRGPQGTLYGKDAIGGVVNFITKAPTNEWEGKIGMEYGSYDYIQGMFNANGPLIVDKLFLGINGEYRQDDGWIENTNPDLNSDGNASKDHRISSYLLVTPTERFSARLTITDNHHEEAWSDGYALPGGSSISDFSRDEAEKIDYDVPTDVTRETFSQSLHLDYDFDAMTLSSTSTHSDMDIEGDYDADYGNNILFAGLKQFNYSELDTYTQEFRLSSSNGNGIRWVGGLYFESEEREQGPYGMQFPNFDPSSYTYIGNFEMNAESVTDSATYAAFGQVVIPLAEHVELTLGGRYQHIEKEIDLDTYYLPMGMAGPPYFSLSGEKDWDAFLPKAALNYHLSDNWNTFISYSRGYMPGGFNYFATSGTIEDNSFEPQESTNYEIGIKGSVDRLQVTAALFHMDIEDIHVYKANGTGIYHTENAERAHSQGIELDLAWRLTDTVDLTAALGLIDAEYDTYDAGDGISFDGQKIQNTPAYTLTTGVSYTHPGGFYSRMDIKAVGDVYFYDDANKAFVEEDSYNTIDAKVGYLTDTWDFYVYGKNLTDEEYIVGYMSSSLLTLADFGDPLTVGAGIRYRF